MRLSSVKIVLGIDPGFGRTGIGVIEIKGSDTVYLYHDCISTAASLPFAERLRIIRDEINLVIEKFKPDVVAIEKLFFQTNVKTAIDVGMARGVIILCVGDACLPMVELTPNEVKQAIAGYGNADKKQMQSMVARLLGLKEVPKPDDAADALAIAMAGAGVYKTRQRLGL
ncbi:MAG TPA: crossover junction endodeoxyribonuclease RuvC [bacterium]|nr:MAG: Crossover junction endodeoxyribonuclease RuvC [Parcubacteria group bacterium ADurb.Bin192]HPN15094.1 crossover junction endodeoxyribonuclease RuvC [bacterium]